jgi:dTDP-D-glucose 4,6-dehydratase
LHNNGLPIRNWLHAKDTAKAVLSVINSGVENEIFNVAGGFEQSNIDTVKKIIDCYFEQPIEDYEKYLNFEISRAGQDVRYGINDDKIRSLGWKPESIFDEEIKEIVEYYKKVFIW